MIQKALSTLRSSCWTRGVACLIILLCICVVTQMLGVPVTLIGLLNADVLTKSEPISEDYSTPSTVPEPGRPRLGQLHGGRGSRGHGGQGRGCSGHQQQQTLQDPGSPQGHPGSYQRGQGRGPGPSRALV